MSAAKYIKTELGAHTWPQPRIYDLCSHLVFCHVFKSVYLQTGSSFLPHLRVHDCRSQTVFFQYKTVCKRNKPSIIIQDAEVEYNCGSAGLQVAGWPLEKGKFRKHSDAFLKGQDFVAIHHLVVNELQLWSIEQSFLLNSVNKKRSRRSRETSIMIIK